jgi:hypothetical protein
MDILLHDSKTDAHWAKVSAIIVTNIDIYFFVLVYHILNQYCLVFALTNRGVHNTVFIFAVEKYFIHTEYIRLSPVCVNNCYLHGFQLPNLNKGIFKHILFTLGLYY